MAGAEKGKKLAMHNMPKDEQREYMLAELERAKATLEQKIRLGDDKAVARVAEIISNLQGTIDRI